MPPMIRNGGEPAAKAAGKASDNVKKTVTKKATHKEAVATKKQSPQAVAKSTAASKASSPFPPPSPTDPDVGVLIQHRINYPAVIGPAREGPVNDVTGIQPFGVIIPGFRCYANSLLVLLMNVPTFVGYLNRINGSNRIVDLVDNATQIPILSEIDALSCLNEIAVAYWANDPAKGTTKQKTIDQLAEAFWTYTMNTQAPEGCPNFIISDYTAAGEVDTESFQDTRDFINAVFQIILFQIQSRPPTLLSPEYIGFQSLFMPLFQKRIACWGVGTTCPNREERIALIAGENDDVIVRLNVNRCSSLKECLDDYMKDVNPGFSRCQSQTCSKKKFGSRIWYKLREAPGVLFIHISRFTPASRKSTKKITIPEILDLESHLENEDRDAGETALYRLDAVVSHAGNVNTGHYITYVRDMTDSTAWYRIDGTKVSRSFFANAVDDPKIYRSWAWTPVILAYSKVGASTTKQVTLTTQSSEAEPRTVGRKTSSKTSTSSPFSPVKTGTKSPTPPPAPADTTFTAQLLPCEGSGTITTIAQTIHYDAGKNGNIPIRVELELPDGRTFSNETTLEETKGMGIVPKQHPPKQLSARGYRSPKSSTSIKQLSPKKLSPKQSHKKLPSPETSLSSDVPSSSCSFDETWSQQPPKSSPSKNATNPHVLVQKRKRSSRSDEDEEDVEEGLRLRSCSNSRAPSRGKMPLQTDLGEIGAC